MVSLSAVSVILKSHRFSMTPAIPDALVTHDLFVFLRTQATNNTDLDVNTINKMDKITLV